MSVCVRETAGSEAGAPCTKMPSQRDEEDFRYRCLRREALYADAVQQRRARVCMRREAQRCAARGEAAGGGGG